MLRIDGPPETKKRRGMATSAQRVGLPNKSDKTLTDLLLTNQRNTATADATALAKRARTALLAATFRLGDDGFECEMLSDLYAGTAQLISLWSGRQKAKPPRVEDTVTYLSAAREWRRLQRRSY